METTAAPVANYSGHGWQGKNYKREMGISAIAKAVRAELKDKHPECKFSVTISRYSMGQSMTVSLMQAPYDVEVLLNNSPMAYHQVNQYYIKDADYLTEKGKEVLLSAKEIVQSYNYSDSDAQIDYFDTNFYLHLQLGKWDHPFTFNAMKN